MEDTVIDNKTIVKELNSLIELDFDAIAAYESAVARLDTEEYRVQLANFKGDHQRHVQVLSDYVRSCDGTPPQSGDMKHILTQGKVIIGDLVGNDKAILKAMKSNEDQTNKAYEKAVNKCEGDDRVTTLLADNLEDEQRHRAWIEAQLAKF